MNDSKCWQEQYALQVYRSGLANKFSCKVSPHVDCWVSSISSLRLGRANPLKGTLKPQSNGPLYSNTVIGTLAVDGWAVTFGTAMRGLGGAPARPGPSSLYQMYQTSYCLMWQYNCLCTLKGQDGWRAGVCLLPPSRRRSCDQVGQTDRLLLYQYRWLTRDAIKIIWFTSSQN